MSAEISMVPQTMTELTDEKQITMMSQLLENMEDNDDVQKCISQLDMPDDLGRKKSEPQKGMIFQLLMKSSKKIIFALLFCLKFGLKKEKNSV